MPDLDLPTLRERCERRLSGLARHRQPWESQWREVADYFQVRRSRWLWGEGWKVGQAWPMGGSEKVNTKLLDPTGVRASETLANGLSSGLISPSRPWFRLTSTDPDLASKQDVKEWLKLVQDAIYNLFATTNFYSQSKAGYKELGLFGCEAGIITQHWRKGLVTHALGAGEFWTAVGDDLTPDTLYRACPMTVAQVVQTFAPPYGTGNWSRNVQQMYDRGELETVVPIMHAIEPNPDRIPGRTDSRNKAWRSVYWECGEDRLRDGAGVLQFSGFDTQPFWCARWEPTGMQAYSVGPGLSALGDGKQLQLQTLRRGQIRDMQARPHMLVPSTMDRFNGIVPGGISTVNAVDQSAVRPMVDPRLVSDQGLSQDIGTTQQQVKDAFYTQLFLAILEADGEMTATEVNLRNMEKYAQLGPVIEANMNEKLRPIINIAFDLLRRTGMLPPAPQSLQGQELDVQFVSQLAQLQRAGEINAIAQSAQFTGTLIAADPGAFDNLDVDKMVERFADLQGLDADLLRSEDEVAQLRQARSDAQRAAQLQAAAPAAKDGAQAAQALAGIDPSKIAGLTGIAA